MREEVVFNRNSQGIVTGFLAGDGWGQLKLSNQQNSKGTGHNKGMSFSLQDTTLLREKSSF